MKQENGKDTRFKPGESGNPQGRPKGSRNTKTIISEFFETEMEFEDIQGIPQKMKMADAIHLKQIKKAIKDGDTQAYRAVMDRFEGSPKQTIEGTHSIQQMPTIKVNGKKAVFDVGEQLPDDDESNS